MLTYRKHVPIGVFEPGHLLARRCSPDAKFLVLNKRIFLEDDAAFG